MVIRDLIDCENEHKLRRPQIGHPAISNDTIKIELDASTHDLDSARRELENGDYKWAIVKSYYSMLHAASALARKRGYVIDNHICMFLFLRRLSERGEIESSDAYLFKTMTDSRVKADYGLSYSKEAAIDGIRISEQFQSHIKLLLSILSK